MAQKYRADIDGLRALAILLVIGFHWQIPGVTGGFVGVDVFFVISGYLITGLIVSELLAGTFSFSGFYERRARKILPALYFMLAVSAVFAWFTLVGRDFTDFIRSLGSVIGLFSNIYFWMHTQYFDRPQVEKPLLHTWTLSVEEQFYLAVPLLLWLAAKLPVTKRHPRIVLGWLSAAFLAASLVASEIAVRTHPQTAFFLAPFRAWEFLMGSVLAIAEPRSLKAGWRVLLFGTGLALIGYAAVSFTGATRFPGLSALYPCGGAALCIWAGGGDPIRHRLRIPRIDVFFGRISYSLYLWHWPVFVFAGILISRPNGFSPTEKALMFAGTTATAYLSFRFVEQPVRRKHVFPTRRSVVLAVLSASVVLVAFSLADFRPSREKEILRYNLHTAEADYRSGTCFLEPNLQFSSYPPDLCAAMSTDAQNVLVWGDSLAAHYVPGLRVLGPQEGLNILQATVALCIPAFDIPQPVIAACDSLNGWVRNFVKTNKLSAVVLSGNWYVTSQGLGYDRMMAGLAGTLAALKETGVTVIVLGPAIQYKTALPSLIIRHRMKTEEIDRGSLAPGLYELDDAMRKTITEVGGITYISVLQTICDPEKCPVMAGPGMPMEWDPVHLTRDGSILAAGKLLPAVMEAIGHGPQK